VHGRSANRKSANLRTYKICYIFGTSASLAICGYAICGPSCFCGLETSTILKFFIFLLKSIYIKCSNPNFYDKKSSRLLGSFAIKGGNFLDRCFILFVLWWEIYRIAVCGLAHIRNLQICDLRINRKKIADSKTSEICGLAIAD
jgi:hypothetical protein